MAGTPFKDGPEFVSNTAGNQFNPAANTYALVRHIHIANTNAASRTIELWLGLTGATTAGTELIKLKTIAANDEYNLYFPSGLKMTNADFLVGRAGTDATSLVITTTGELYAA